MENSFKVNDKISVIGKNVSGNIAYIGTTHFSEGKWFGIILDEAKGRNNGSIDGKRYFKCPRNYGLFVRSCLLQKETTGSESNAKSAAKKVTYPNYLSKSPVAKSSKPEEKRRCDVKIKTAKTLPPVVQPKTGAIQDLENIIKQKSEEIDKLKTVYKEAEVKCHVEEAEKQKLSQDLKHKDKKVKELEKMLTTSQTDFLILYKEFRSTKKLLERSEERQRQVEGTFEELRDITETAIIDKEMAEERSEELELRLKDEVDKCKTLQVELEIRKEEMQLQCVNGLPVIHYVKKLENENEVLKSALGQLGDIYKNLQQQLFNSKKILQEYSEEIECLKGDEKAMEETLHKYKTEISELYGEIDVMLIADDVVFEVAESNLRWEDKVMHLHDILRNNEEKLEVSEEVEETLQEIKSICGEEIECLEIKVNAMQSALDQKTNLLMDREEVIEKYRKLTSTFEEENRTLTGRIKMLQLEKQEAVRTAENLKLKNHQEKSKVLKELIQIENMKIDLQRYKEERNYWLPFMPDGFFAHVGENSAIQVRLISSKMMKKLELLIELLQSSCTRSYNISKEEELRTLALETRFLLSAYEFHSLLNLYIESFDHIHAEHFLSLSTFLDTIELTDKEVDRFLTLLSTGELDTSQSLKNLDNTRYLLSRILYTYVPEIEKTMIDFKCYLNMIHISCKCIQEHCLAIDSMAKISAEYKSGANLLMESAKQIEKNVNLSLNIFRGHKKEKLYVPADAADRVKNNWLIIQEIMEFKIACHQSVVVEDQESMAGTLNEQNNTNFNEMVHKFMIADKDIDELHMLVSKGDFFVEPNADFPVFSTVHTWAQFKMQQEEHKTSKLKNEITSCELEIIKLNDIVEIQKKQLIKSKRVSVKVSSSQQTDDTDVEVVVPLQAIGDTSANSEFLTSKLQGMECLLQYLSQKNFELRTVPLRVHRDILKPLNVSPKPKYNRDTHRICVLQKRLNELAVKLRGILLPTVADITKNHSCNEKMYQKYQTERALIRKEIEDSLWNIIIDLKKLRISPKCVWSDTNSFYIGNEIVVEN